jgi:hypothetical protein
VHAPRLILASKIRYQDGHGYFAQQKQGVQEVTETGILLLVSQEILCQRISTITVDQSFDLR